MKLRKVKKANGEIVSLNMVCYLGNLGQDGADQLLDPREAPIEGQELWHLDPIRFPLRNPQHVQGVP
jgi:hypothetical protein